MIAVLEGHLTPRTLRLRILPEKPPRLRETLYRVYKLYQYTSSG